MRRWVLGILAVVVVAGLGLAILTYLVGRRWFDAATGFFAATVVATSFGYFSIGRLSLPDLPLAFFIAAATWGLIEGIGSQEEVQDLSLILRSGSLPAQLTYLQERKIGPTLGADSIRAGFVASLVGLLLVVAFMLVYYKLSGVNAVVALIFNLVILLGLMAYVGAVMTLQGVGAALSPTLGGFVAERIGYSASFAALGLCALAGLVLWVLARPVTAAACGDMTARAAPQPAN